MGENIHFFQKPIEHTLLNIRNILCTHTGLGSVAAGTWRFLLMPIDTLKTTMQVQGTKGLPQIATRLKEEGVSSLYQGAVAQAVATAVSSVFVTCA